MSGFALFLYHRMPPSMRSLAASLRGRQLSLWRYGPDTERLVEEAQEREGWSAQQWRCWQDERIAFLLHRAVTKVPYYRQQWEARRRDGDRSSWEDLKNWPILEKEALREDSRAFVADDCDIRKMFHEHTSGTTGKSLDLWWDRRMVRAWYALFEARWRQWYGVSRFDRWAILGGQLITPVAQKQPPFWVWNAALRQLYMSAYHLAPDLIPFYLDALARYKIVYLWGYTSALYALAQEAVRLRRRDIRMQVIIANAEPVFDYQRQTIEAAFQCPLRETYGMSEAVAAASECEANRLHLWPEAGVVEVLHEDQPVPAGAMGDFVCTGLMNENMPLIRYRVGDRGALAPMEENCACGRLLPLLAGIEGRCDDVLYTQDGRRIGRLDPVFKASLPVREAQIVQEALSRLRVRYVPAPGFNEEARQSIVQRLRERMGDVEVILEALDEVPRTSNGKFRAVICQLSEEERDIVLDQKRRSGSQT